MLSGASWLMLKLIHAEGQAESTVYENRFKFRGRHHPCLLIGVSSKQQFLWEVQGSLLCENRKRCHQHLLEDTWERDGKRERRIKTYKERGRKGHKNAGSTGKADGGWQRQKHMIKLNQERWRGWQIEQQLEIEKVEWKTQIEGERDSSS